MTASPNETPPEGQWVSNSQDLQILGTNALPAAEPADVTVPSQRGRPFLPGRSGNPAGRPKGARNKLTETFVTAIAADFAEHGPTVLEKLRKTDPEAYLKIVSRLVPRELVLERERDPGFADMTEDEVVELLDRAQRDDLVRSYLRQILPRQGS
jgi:Family of unknown function (DUF5681)